MKETVVKKYKEPFEGVSRHKIKNGGKIKTARGHAVIKKHNMLDESVWTELVSEALFAPESEGGLKPTLPYERTSEVTQKELEKDLDFETHSKLINLILEHGPYQIDMTEDGQFLLLGGQRGQCAMIELANHRVIFDKNLLQTVRSVKCLFNENHLAVLGRKYLSIYDKQCTEIHCFRSFQSARLMDFLPYHALMVVWTESQELRYVDLTTGECSATHTTRGSHGCLSMKRNERTGVIYLGDSKGNLSLWTPNLKTPAVKFHAHPSSITALCPLEEFYLATGAVDCAWKIWDIRKAEEPVALYRSSGLAPSCMTASGTGLLAVGYGGRCDIWKDITSKPKLAYMRHQQRDGTNIKSLAFRAHEDFLYMGHSEGLRSLVVPGSGLSNIDRLSVSNPYSTSKFRGTMLVKRIMEKLPADSIVLRL